MLKEKIREIAEHLYIRASLDVLNEKNRGKGKELCEKRLDKTVPRILSAFREVVVSKEELVVFIKYFAEKDETGNYHIPTKNLDKLAQALHDKIMEELK